MNLQKSNFHGIDASNEISLSDRAQYIKTPYLATKLRDLKSYFGHENIFGSDYSPITETEAIQDTPELSEFALDDIMNEPAQEAQQAPKQAATLQPCTFTNVLCFKGRDKVEDADRPQATTAPQVIAPTTPDKLAGYKTLKIGNFTFVEYSEKSFALLGDTKEDTKSIKDQLYLIGGKFNYYLKCGEGFIFSNRKYYTVKTFIEKL